jgi:hypothetical protein
MPSLWPLSEQHLSSKNKYQETTLMQNEPMKQMTAEDVPPRWLRLLRPLRRPRTPIELILMRTICGKNGKFVTRSSTTSQSPEPSDAEPIVCGLQKEGWHRPTGIYI